MASNKCNKLRMMYLISKKKKSQLSFQRECHLAKPLALPHEISAYIYIYIYIYIDLAMAKQWRRGTEHKR